MSGPTAATAHMPFAGHRTQQEVREEQDLHAQLPWCPMEYRDHFRVLRGKCGSADARRMIEEQMEADNRRCSTNVHYWVSGVSESIY